MMKEWVKSGDRWISQVCKWFSVIGAIGLIAMMVLVTIDVVGRFLFDKPLVGAYELVEYLMIIVIFLAIPYGQVKKQHVSVELLAELLKGRARAVLNSITYLLSLAIFVLISWASVKQTLYIWKAKQSSSILLLPQWPVVTVMAIGCTVFTLYLLIDLLNNLIKTTGK